MPCPSAGKTPVRDLARADGIARERSQTQSARSTPERAEGRATTCPREHNFRAACPCAVKQSSEFGVDLLVPLISERTEEKAEFAEARFARKTLSDAPEQLRCFQFGLPGKVKLKHEPIHTHPAKRVLSRCSWRGAIECWDKPLRFVNHSMRFVDITAIPPTQDF